MIVYPTGGGVGLIGMWKAFEELGAMGLVDSRRPAHDLGSGGGLRPDRQGLRAAGGRVGAMGERGDCCLRPCAGRKRLAIF